MIKPQIEQLAPDERLTALAFLKHLMHADDPGYQAELARRHAEMDAAPNPDPKKSYASPRPATPPLAPGLPVSPHLRDPAHARANRSGLRRRLSDVGM